MFRISAIASALLMVSVLGCDEETVCDEAWDVQKSAMEEACQQYEECCYCDCALRNDCFCDESIEFLMRDEKCTGEIKDRANGCLGNEENCAEIWTNNVDMLCSSEG